MPALAFPRQWDITQNGFGGLLVLNFAGQPTLDDSFTFTGTLDSGGPSTVSGSWDGVAKMIAFVRVIPNVDFTQTFIGFLGDGDPNSLSLAGSISATNYLGSLHSLRNQFGWFAKQI